CDHALATVCIIPLSYTTLFRSRRHVAATRGRSLPEGAGMNDQENIEHALAVDDAPVDTEGALARFRARVGREGVLPVSAAPRRRSEEHTSELQSRENLVCRLLL